MSAFDAAALVTAAKERFGESALRSRMRGAELDNEDPGDAEEAADEQLLEIAAGVISRVQSAAVVSVGWPFPAPFDETWPAAVFENALTLFNWWTVRNLEQATDNQRRAGEAAEKYFQAIADGGIAIGIGTTGDAGPATILAARNRDGSSNVPSVPDTTNVLDIFTGDSWDI